MAMASVNSLANSLCFTHGLQPLEHAYAVQNRSSLGPAVRRGVCRFRGKLDTFNQWRSSSLLTWETLLNLAGRLKRGAR